MSQISKAEAVLDALSTFKKKMVEASLLSRASAQRFDSELRALKEEKERGCQHDIEGLPRSVNNMIYHDLRSGTATVYGTKHLFLDDQVTAAHLHKNRHYQWVLVEAYEAFENFLENIYASMGCADISFWPMSDFGNIKIPDIATKDIEWFLKQVKQKKNKPNSILNNFRSSFLDLRDVEVNNKCNVHVVFELILISKLRHLIVHNSGRVANKEEVVRRMLTDAAINDKHKEQLAARADKFFKKTKDTQEVHVYLLGHTDPDYPIFSTHNLGDLMGFLVGYAQVLTELSIAHLYEKGLIANTTDTSSSS